MNHNVTLVRRRFNIGQKYIFLYGKEKIIVKFIQVTKKGYNFLLPNNKTLITTKSNGNTKHLYKANKQNGNSNMEFIIIKRMSNIIKEYNNNITYKENDNIGEDNMKKNNLKWKTFKEEIPQYNKTIFVYDKESINENGNVVPCSLDRKVDSKEGSKYYLLGYNKLSDNKLSGFDQKVFNEMKWMDIPKP